MDKKIEQTTEQQHEEFDYLSDFYFPLKEVEDKYSSPILKRLREKYTTWIENGELSKEVIANELMYYLPEITYEDLGKYLDDKM